MHPFLTHRTILVADKPQTKTTTSVYNYRSEVMYTGRHCAESLRHVLGRVLLATTTSDGARHSAVVAVAAASVSQQGVSVWLWNLRFQTFHHRISETSKQRRAIFLCESNVMFGVQRVHLGVFIVYLSSPVSFVSLVLEQRWPCEESLEIIRSSESS